jgi:hypothetical protein
VGWIWGDAAMLAVVAGTAAVTDHLVGRYLLSVVVIAVGSYFMFGWPQLRIWSLERSAAERREESLVDSPRMAWALGLLKRGGTAMYLAAAAIEGPLLIGWWAGRVNHRRQRLLTWLSAWILAVIWAAVYLVFSVWALIAVVGIVVTFAAARMLASSRA